MEWIGVLTLPYPKGCRLCATKSCREDGGRPSGVVVQARIPNHHKLLWSKAIVVSVMEKAKLDFVRYVLWRRMQMNQ